MTPEEVKQLFAGNRFGLPCDEELLAAAEADLRVTIPPELRPFYLSFDGFLGPTAAYFFWPLFARDQRKEIGFVETNKWLRTEFPEGIASQCLFFGDDGCGFFWGIYQQAMGKVIMWEGALGNDFWIAGTDPGDVWSRKKQSYEQAAKSRRRR